MSSQTIDIAVFVNLEGSVRRCSDGRVRNLTEELTRFWGRFAGWFETGLRLFLRATFKAGTNLKISHEALELRVFSERIPPGLDFEEDHPA